MPLPYKFILFMKSELAVYIANKERNKQINKRINERTKRGIKERNHWENLKGVKHRKS